MPTLLQIGAPSSLHSPANESWKRLVTSLFAAGNATIGVGGSYQKRRYRLKDEGPPDKGIGEETALPIFGRVGYSPNENVSLAVMGGVTVAGEVRSGQENGDKIFKENYDPAPFGGVQLRVRF